MAVAWERCVREVTLSADPGTVGSLSGGWHNLFEGLKHLRDALVGQAFMGPIAPGTTRPGVGSLTDLLASWQGTGGDAYRDHLSKLGAEIEELATYAANVEGALSRIAEDIETTVASIPIPLLDDFGWKEWSLPNGTELDSASDGRNADGFLRALRKDYQSDPSAYADGAFRDRADDLEATMKIDGGGDGQKRGGWWDTQSHLDNWYRDNQQAANGGMSPLPAAVEAERPKLVVPPPSHATVTGIEDDDIPYTPPVSTKPDGRVSPIGGKPDSTSLPKTVSTSIGDPAMAKPPGFADSYTPQPRSPQEYGSGLAGVGDGGGYRGAAGLGGGPGSLGGLGVGGPGAGGATGAAGGLGAGAAAPGLVAGAAGKRPPLTSAGNALRAAMAEGGRGGAPGAMGGGPGGHGGGQGARGAGPGGMGMMGGGGGLGAHGGGAGEEHKSWLVEDDDPWGAGGDAPPGVLR